MVQSLRSLSLAAAARNFWDSHKFEQGIRPDMNEYLPVFVKFGEQIDSMWLPVTTKPELKLAMVEFGKRKFVKEIRKQYLGLAAERPKSLDKALREFLPKYFHDHPDVKIKVPALRQYFPEEHHQRIVLDFFFALTQLNPHDDPSAILECWTILTLERIQTIFLDHFTEIWIAIVESRTLSTEPPDEEAIDSVRDFLVGQPEICNETIPWFVFEVLTEDQRNRFIGRIRETPLLMRRVEFLNFFASIFCHWPWQEGAIDMYFAQKELSDNDVIALRYMEWRKSMDEAWALNRKVLIPKVALYLKVGQILKTDADSVTHRNKRQRLS